MSSFTKLIVCVSVLCVSCTQQAVISLHYTDGEPVDDILLVVTTPGAVAKRHEETGVVYREKMPRHYEFYAAPKRFRSAPLTTIELPNTCDTCEAATYRSMNATGGKYGDPLADKKRFIPCHTKAIHLNREGQIEIISR